MFTRTITFDFGGMLTGVTIKLRVLGQLLTLFPEFGKGSPLVADTTWDNDTPWDGGTYWS